MKILLLTIGDELLYGNIVNTNAAFIGQELAKIGAQLTGVQTISDNTTAIYQALERGMQNFQVVVSTGGLGPTVDDITKQQIAEYFGTRLVLDQATLESIKLRFQKRQVQMTESNIGQALVPEGCEILANPNGTAPGLHLRKNAHLFFALPGVPREMEWLFLNCVLPRLKPLIGDKIIRHRFVITAGLPESTLGEKLLPVTDQQNEYSIAFLPGHQGNKVRISAAATTEDAVTKIFDSVENQIRSILGNKVVGIDEHCLEVVIGNLLRQQKRTLAVAESCTGGLLSDVITNVPGCSDYFERSIISYSNESKIALLNVKKETIEEFGAVSEEVACQMAEGVRINAGTDVGLSTTGIAGPTGETSTKPIGLVYIGYSDTHKTFARKHQFLGSRAEIKDRSVLTALDLLRLQLLETS